MESTTSQPVYISNNANELFTDQCSFEDGSGNWQDLEHFWGEEKYRLYVDGQAKPLPSSLEEHLLHDEFLKEPQGSPKNEYSLELKTIRGEDINDIPTNYTIAGFRPQELIVIGTYVHKDIIPGFKYRIRKNLTEEYLFDGKAKYLESVGLGYGKRLTFEGDTLNENENYFWSDSRTHGYGFIFQTMSDEDIFNILDTKTGKEIGRVVINNPAVQEDIVLTTIIGEQGYVEKEVEVQFSCDITLHDSLSQQNIFMEDVSVQGKAIIVRESMSSKAKVNQIFLDEFVVDACILLPEE